MPGQRATAFAHGKPGLTLGGSGTFSPIEHGKPRPSAVERVPASRAGLPAPRTPAGHGVTRISSSLGEVKLNFHKVTHGLARGSASTAGLTRNASNNATVWSSGDSGSQATGNSGQSGNSAGSMVAGSSASTVVAATGGGNNGNGNGGPAPEASETPGPPDNGQTDEAPESEPPSMEPELGEVD